MRVIAGTYRSRPLRSPNGRATRPTSDRLRETLFNILQPRTAGSRFVDLYSGTGAVGIEALSRGAQHVWFSENSSGALLTLRENLRALKIASGFTLETRGTEAALLSLTQLSASVDIVFLDPPYDAEAEYESTLAFFGSARGGAVLSPDAIVIAEHSSKVTLPLRYGQLEQCRRLKQGDAALSFYRITPHDAETPRPHAGPSLDQP